MVKTIAPGHWESITPEAARNGDRIDFSGRRDCQEAYGSAARAKVGLQHRFILGLFAAAN